MTTTPAKFEGGIICEDVSVRFINEKRHQIRFSGNEVTGCKFINVSAVGARIILRYITPRGLVMKSVVLNRNEVLEVMQEGSYCLAQAVE